MSSRPFPRGDAWLLYILFPERLRLAAVIAHESSTITRAPLRPSVRPTAPRRACRASRHWPDAAVLFDSREAIGVLVTAGKALVLAGRSAFAPREEIRRVGVFEFEHTTVEALEGPVVQWLLAPGCSLIPSRSDPVDSGLLMLVCQDCRRQRPREAGMDGAGGAGRGGEQRDDEDALLLPGHRAHLQRQFLRPALTELTAGLWRQPSPSRKARAASSSPSSNCPAPRCGPGSLASRPAGTSSRRSPSAAKGSAISASTGLQLSMRRPAQWRRQRPPSRASSCRSRYPPRVAARSVPQRRPPRSREPNRSPPLARRLPAPATSDLLRQRGLIVSSAPEAGTQGCHPPSPRQHAAACTACLGEFW